MLAAFGTYFCMYAFRKPFNAGTYEGFTLWDMDYKAILIIAQVLGYMTSKFIGIKVISELKAHKRKKLIIGLILFAESALLLFGLVPHPYNFVFLFLNGLPLGMVWGIVFSYLEGRMFTETLAMGLSISLIISSGFLKTIYFYVQAALPLISEFWMPAVIGIFFLPLFLLFVWMLSVIPAPSAEDIVACPTVGLKEKYRQAIVGKPNAKSHRIPWSEISTSNWRAGRHRRHPEVLRAVRGHLRVLFETRSAPEPGDSAPVTRIQAVHGLE